jgi:AcrR family transcriptional regulator
MTRSPTDSEHRLLAAGKAILQEQGFGGLSVRAVAAKAGLNQGLLSYHFGGKKAFVQRVAQEIYEDFFKGLNLDVEGEQDPLKALRKGLLRLATFVRDHRPFVRGMIRDVSAGDEAARAFAKANVPRHGKLIVGLLKRCTAEGKLAELPVPLMMGSLMAQLSMPTLMADVMMGKHCPEWMKHDPKVVENAILTDAALSMRVDLALKALKP